MRLSPVFTPPPGSSQYSLPGFSWRQSMMDERQLRIADTRIRGSPPGPDDAPLAGRERGVFARGEIEAGIARVGGVRQNGVVAQTPNGKLDQCAPAAGVSTAAATRYGAKRRSCARGRRARTKTPSGR